MKNTKNIFVSAKRYGLFHRIKPRNNIKDVAWAYLFLLQYEFQILFKILSSNYVENNYEANIFTAIYIISSAVQKYWWIIEDQKFDHKQIIQ